MFTCPFCAETSANPTDTRERYCAHCHVFVDDLLTASPTICRVMARLWHRLAETRPEHAAENKRLAAAWEAAETITAA